MFEELNHYLGWTSSFARNDSILVLNEGVDAGFLLHHFISCFLKEHLPVCLVSTSQAFSHYAHTGSKIGTNLDKALKDGKIRHIDLMSRFSNQYLQLSDNVLDAKGIFLNIKSEMSILMETSTNALLLIDDFSVLSSLVPSMGEGVQLLHYLRTMSKSMGFCVVIAIPKLLCERTKKIESSAMHYADMVLGVQSLRTGYSKDVHGQLHMLKGGNNAARQYKLSDKTLRIFAVGTSTAVL